MFKITASEPLLIRYSVPLMEMKIPSHCSRFKRSRRKMAARSAVMAGVKVAIKVALATVEYCRPANWEPLFRVTPVRPIRTRRSQQSLGGSSCFSPRIFMMMNKVPLKKM